MRTRLETPEDLLAALEGRPGLNLFPTENRMSPRALRALSCDAVNRYPGSEGDTFFYGDTMGLGELYERCSALAQTFFGSRFAFASLLSGLHAMHAVVSSLSSRGARVFIMNPSCGGHYATETICNGYGFETSYLPFDRETCLIDLDQLERLIAKGLPDLVYLDLSTIVRLPRI